MFKDTKNGQTNFNLPCGHTLWEHQMMEEAKASSEIEGARTDKTICELIDLANRGV